MRLWPKKRPVVIPIRLTGTPYSLGRYVIPVGDPYWREWKRAAKGGAYIEMGDPRLVLDR